MFINKIKSGIKAAKDCVVSGFRRGKKVIVAAGAAIGVGVAGTKQAFAQAAADADVSAMTADALLTFDVVKAAAITIVVFAVGYRLFRRFVG